MMNPPSDNLGNDESHVMEMLREKFPGIYERAVAGTQAPTPRKRSRTFQCKSDPKEVARAIRRRFGMAERVEIIRKMLEED
jgi:hypothetical protein